MHSLSIALPAVHSLSISLLFTPEVIQAEHAVLWKGLREKVTAIAWHPHDDSIIAFGMEDGVAGVYALAGSGAGRGHTILPSRHRGRVAALVHKDPCC